MRVSIFIVFFLFNIAIVIGLVASKCPAIKVRKDTIIRTKDSIRKGARLLSRVNVNSSRDCYKLCCNTRGCSIGVMHYKRVRTFDDDIEARKICFIFACGSPSRCSFMNHNGYAVIEMERGQATNDVGKVRHRTIPKEEKCAPGMPVAMCASDPCANAVCHGHKSATCVPSYCGGCGFVFYDSNGDKLSCQVKHKKTKKKQEKENMEGERDNNTHSTEDGKKQETDGDKVVVKEEEVEVHPEETSGKPRNDLFAPEKTTEDDPHKVKEYREWLDSGKEKISSQAPHIMTTVNKESIPKGTKEPVISLQNKKPGRKIVLKKDSPISWALLIALSICIVVLLTVVIKLKCFGPKKKKKFAVDDGDYLINGMYL